MTTQSDVRRAKSDVEEVQRDLGRIMGYVDMNGQNGSYVYSQLNGLKSKLDDVVRRLRRIMPELSE